MRDCPRCGRSFAEVLGAPEQACPHCGHVFASDADAPAMDAGVARVDPVAALARAGRELRERYPLLLLAWLPSVVAWSLVYVLLLIVLPDPERMQSADRLRALGIVLPPVFLAFTIDFALWVVVAGVVRGGAVSAREVVARPGVILGLGLLLTLTYAAGALLLLVPLFVFFHWFLHAPAALAEGGKVGAAMEASRAFAKRRKTFGFTALVVVAWTLVFVASYLLADVLAPALAALHVPYPDAFASALAAWPFAPLVPLLPASYWALAGNGTAPATVVRAAPARRNTTCPSCGALIPYEPTGAPVEVTCATCGTKGRVL